MHQRRHTERKGAPIQWDAWPASDSGGPGGEEPPAWHQPGRSFDPFGYGYGAHGTAGYSGDLGPGWNELQDRGTGRTGHRRDLPDDDGARAFVVDARDPDRRGAFVGRGPRGRRSDARIQEDVCQALTLDPHVDATDVEVTVEHGEVTLAGAVEDRRQKKLAEAAAEQVDGVRDVHNRLRVGLTAAPVRA